MATYYAKRALEILRENGPVELFRKSIYKSLYFALIPFKLPYRHYKPKLQYIRYHSRYGNSAPKQYGLIYVDPNHVKKILIPPLKSRFDDDRIGNRIIGGSWDTEYKQIERIYPCGYGIDQPGIYPLKKTDLYKAGEAYHKKGESMESTIVYDLRSKSLADKKCRKVQQTIDNIEQNGYLTQRELLDRSPSKVKSKIGVPPEWDEVRIAIARNGDLLLEDGIDRLIAAKLLDIEQMPVRVVARHKKWQELRDEINKNGLLEGRENLQNHPDLHDILD